MTTPTPPRDQNPFSAPSTAAPIPNSRVVTGDATGGVIPYKNPCALTAYYLGIVALLPVVGMPFGVASLVLGIIGLQRRAKNPVVKGSVHAIIGIVGGLLSLFCGGFLLMMIFSQVFSG